MKIEPLSSALGARVSGLDLPSASPDTLIKLRELWLDRLVVVVSGPVLGDDDFVAFAEGFVDGFGTIRETRLQSRLSTRREIKVISNIREGGVALGDLPDGEMSFHYDMIYYDRPNRAGVLQAVEIPSTGGDTCFSNACLAYERLPEKTKQKLEGLTALHTYSYGTTIANEKQSNPQAPRASHPLVRTIPETGRKALYLCRLMTDRINELNESESRQLLDDLFDHVERPEYTYRHTWSVGDLLIWDNHCTVHARTDFSPEERRLLKRLTINAP